jgi:acylphosphatase
MTSQEEVTRAIVWSGRVQGVGFREAACYVAAMFAIRGVIRNETDGSVRCELCGADAEIDRFIESVEARMDRYVHDRLESAPGVLTIPSQGLAIAG